TRKLLRTRESVKFAGSRSGTKQVQLVSGRSATCSPSGSSLLDAGSIPPDVTIDWRRRLLNVDTWRQSLKLRGGEQSRPSLAEGRGGRGAARQGRRRSRVGEGRRHHDPTESADVHA